MSLLAGQSSLPRLPVPPLRKTLTKLVRSLQPLCDAEEFSRVLALAEDFADGVGPQLQKRLEERNRSEGAAGRSWLSQWWDDEAYLVPRIPLPIHVSFAMSLTATPPRTRCAARAASLCAALLRLKSAVDTRTLEADPQPCDQAPYTYVFGACRVPGAQRDCIVRYHHSSSHVAVVHRGVWWIVETGWHPVATMHQLEAVFERIVRDNHARSRCPVGVLTGAQRAHWHSAHEELLRAGNATVLRAIESAAFVLCLDDNEAPASVAELAALMLHASPRSCGNRWYDKTLQLIVCANGRAGICGEHSPVDGMPVARLVDMMVDIEAELLAAPSSDAGDAAMALEVRPLTWQVTPALMRMVDEAHKFVCAEIEAVVMEQCVFDHYGKESIKRLGISPDAWCQAMLQLAFHRRHDCFAPTYESASTSRFAHGRTETGRPLTSELARFVRSMRPQSTSTREQRRALLVLAAKAHVAYMRAASQGLGVDRHLLAMRLLSPPGHMHPFLSDRVVRDSHTWRLSTSQLPVRHMVVSFGPVANGYGVCYQIHGNRIHWSVSAFRAGPCGNVGAYCEQIRRAGSDMMDLFDQVAAL